MGQTDKVRPGKRAPLAYPVTIICSDGQAVTIGAFEIESITDAGPPRWLRPWRCVVRCRGDRVYFSTETGAEIVAKIAAAISDHTTGASDGQQDTTGQGRAG